MKRNKKMTRGPRRSQLAQQALLIFLSLGFPPVSNEGPAVVAISGPFRQPQNSMILPPLPTQAPRKLTDQTLRLLGRGCQQRKGVVRVMDLSHRESFLHFGQNTSYRLEKIRESVSEY